MVRALIVDDSNAELDVLIFLIKKYKLPLYCLTATDGEEALALLQKSDFEILITDIKMPFMDGLSLTSEALKLHPHLKVIISSGYQDFTYAKTAITLGVKEYLLKPVNPSEFISLMSKIIQQIDIEQINKREYLLQRAHSRDLITYRILNGSLRPGKDGLFPREDRDFMPDSCILILISAEPFHYNALFHLKPEIMKLADQLFDCPVRCMPLEPYLLLTIDSVPESFVQSPNLLTKHTEDFAKRLQKMYNIPVWLTACFSFSPEEILCLVNKMKEELSSVSGLNPPSGQPEEMELISSSGKVRYVCDYITSHYNEDLSLESLAGIACIHPDYLSRIFKKETGMNLNRYIKTIRLNQACQLLENSQQKIVTISEAVGYQNCAYFIRVFTEMYGISPEKYRQQNSRRTKNESIT